MSDNETTLLEIFNQLDTSEQTDLLDYAQYKIFQKSQKANNNLNKKDSNNIQGRYVHLDQKNSGDITA